MSTGSQADVFQLIAPSPGTGPGVGGSILKAPIGTPLPSAPGQPLNAAFTDLGYCDENGIKEHEERRNHDVFAWGGAVVANLQDSYARTMTIKFLQYLDPNVLSVAYGANNTTITPNTAYSGTEVAVAINDLILDTLAWAFQGFYKGAQILKVVPVARVVQIGDVNWTHTDLTTVEVQLKAFPDNLGNYEYLYVNDGVTTSTWS